MLQNENTIISDKEIINQERLVGTKGREYLSISFICFLLNLFKSTYFRTHSYCKFIYMNTKFFSH